LRRIISTASTFFVTVFFLLPAARAQQAAVPTISLEIPRPPELQRDVDFWVRVYSEITTLQGFMHDERNLAVVYEIVDLTASGPFGSATRRQRIAHARERWKSALDEAGKALGHSDLTRASADARRVIELWGSEATPARLRAARDSVRFQLGQADRFRAGIVRSGTWESYIASTFSRLGLPPELAVMPHVESSYTPTAYSKVGASGLWQFMRSTGRLYMRVDDIVDERLDPFRSTEAAARLLLDNYRLLGSWPLAITAYNHGPAGMHRARETMGTDDFAIIARRYQSRSFGFASRNFFPSFLAALTIDQNATRYFPGVVRAPEMSFHEVEMPGYAAASQLERTLGVPMALLRELNPALRPPVWSGSRFVPRGYRLRLPAEQKMTTVEFIQRVGANQLFVAQVGPRTHRVKRGESLRQIARKYGYTVNRVAELNGLSNSTKLRRGRALQLPDERPATLADLAARSPPPSPSVSTNSSL